jgi:hypothetical protein
MITLLVAYTNHTPLHYVIGVYLLFILSTFLATYWLLLNAQVVTGSSATLLPIEWKNSQILRWHSLLVYHDKSYGIRMLRICKTSAASQ